MVLGTFVERPNAILILNPPDGNQGLLLPQVTAAKRVGMTPVSPDDDGLVVYDITDASFYHWKQSAWVKGLSNAANQTLTFDPTTNKITLSNGNVIDLTSLKEIPAVTGQAGKYLTTDGISLSWATVTSLGDITSVVAGPGLTGGGTSGDATLSVKTDNTTISVDGAGQLQLANGAVNTGKITPGSPNTVLTTDATGLVTWSAAANSQHDLSLVANSLNITGGTSADLNTVTTAGKVTGPLNNLTIAPAAVTATELAAGSVSDTKLASGITASKIAPSSTNGQVLTTIGGVTTWTTPAAGGTVTNIATGTGLTGGPISTTGTIGLANTSVAAGTYGNPTQVGQFQVDAQGRITSASNVTITGAAPTGAAGGDLTGNFPNPTIATTGGNNINAAINNAATTTLINANRLANTVVLDTETPVGGDVAGTYAAGLTVNNNAITAAKIASNAVTDTKIASGITASKLAPSSTNGQVLTTVGGATTWATPAATGTVTNITTGIGLTGGPISTSGNIALANTSVAAGTYGTATQVGQFQVDAQGRITSASNVTITGAAPTGAAGGDLTGNFPNPTVATTAGNNLNAAINNAATTTLINPNRLATTVVLDTETPIGGDVAGTYAAGLTVNNNAITTAKIASNAVTDAKIASGITASKLAPSSTNGQVLTTVGGATTWANATSGTVTTINTGTGLTGGPISSSGTLALANTSVTAGTYGTATQVGQFQVDAQGRITSASNVTITGAAPTGAAGGDLSGNFPNPTIATSGGNNINAAINNAATTTLINANRLAATVVLDTEAPTGGEIAGTYATGLTINAGAVTNAKIATGVAPAKLTPGTNGQVLTTVAGNTAWANLPASGTVTSISTGTGLSGGPITSSGTINLSNTAVTPGSYGTNNSVSQITIDAQGRITNAASVPITGIAPSGTAGGDLTGTYPNPTIASAAGADIATAINNTAANGSITGTKINPDFGTQTIRTNGTMSINGTSTLNGLTTFNNGITVTGTTTLTGLGGGTNMVVAGPTGALSTQPIPAALTTGTLSSSTPALQITGGANAVVGSGTSLSIQTASAAQAGILTAADFTTFNNKLGPTTNFSVGDVQGNQTSGLNIQANTVGDTEVTGISPSKILPGGASPGDLLTFVGGVWAPRAIFVDNVTVSGSGASANPFRLKPGSANEFLITNSSGNVQWINENSLNTVLAASGDVTGTLNATTVAKIQGVSVSTTVPTNQQALVYDQPSGMWKPTSLAGAAASAAFKVTQNFQQTAIGSFPTEVLWNVETYDDGNNFGFNRFTAPATGLYHFDVIVTIENLDKQDDVQIAFRTGTIVTTEFHKVIGNTGQNPGDVSASTSTDVKLNAGDQVSVWMTVSGGSRNTIGQSIRTQFSGRKIY